MAENREALRVPLTYSCSRCTTRWSGINRCHCSKCHQTFSSPAMFDRHRVNGQCVSPETITNARTKEPIMKLADGVWRSTDEYRDAKALFPKVPKGDDAA